MKSQKTIKLHLKKANTLIKQKDDIILKNNNTIDCILNIVKNSTDPVVKKKISSLLARDD